MEGGSKFYKNSFCITSFQVVVLLGFVWFLLVGVQENPTTKDIATLNAQLEGSHVKIITQRSISAHRKLELNFVSKRRVPNGPDPIHNRRAGNSHQPPGRA